uniref:Uncharacterized protein LOC111116099 isoform X2 n=1 Tax=Crassostrea virginica TaxID=6565 RepID=A0A8B8C5D5_CRAVI|nr:uncharacterized protein LOC111116099 isoform X2 [Crassostrea virginica]
MDKMRSAPCQLLVICLIVCAALDNDGTFPIMKKFMFGDVLFTWNGNQNEGYNVSITKDNAGIYWKHVNNSQYIEKNAWSFKTLEINVHRLNGDQVGRTTYTVQKTFSKAGQSVTLSWSTAFFPSAGVYTIYHTNIVNGSVIELTSNGVTKMQKEKYEYHSYPYNSTHISFEIKNVSLEDAGYYAGGATSEAAWLEGGIILIVNDKPSKPTIEGDLNITVDSFLELHCSSQSHSAPEYYAKLVSLHFMWFLNNTKLTNEYNNTLRRHVSRVDRNSQYSCIVKKDTVESAQSDPVQINLLYGPDTLRINPSVNEDSELSIKEGQALGTYDCSADCNPPCNIAWQYTDTGGHVHRVNSSKKTARLNLIVNRTIILFSCQGTYNNSSLTLEQNMSLIVQYLDETQVIANGRQDPGQIVLEENKTLHLSCYGNGNPNPTIRLSKHNGITKTLETIDDKWLNHTIERLQCTDSDTYKCTSTTTGFQNKEKMIRVSVQCKLRLDTSFPVKTEYTAVVGEGVPVDVPVIANPAPLESIVTWNGPTESIKVTSEVIRRDADYKYNIRGSISIDNEQRIGNYTMLYDGKEIITIIIYAIKGLPQKSSGQNTVVVLGSAVGVTVGVLILTVLAAVFFLKRKKVEIIRKSILIENAIALEGIEHPSDEYAVVNKTPIDFQKFENDATIQDHMEMYANTAKEIPKGCKTNNKIMKKKINKSSRPSTEIIPEESASPEENPDGLLYIDVDFANEQEHPDTDEKPKIHGDDDRTDYSFVDFSKKHPAEKDQEN